MHDWRRKWPEHINAPHPDLPPTVLGKVFILLSRATRRLGEWLDRRAGR